MISMLNIEIEVKQTTLKSVNMVKTSFPASPNFDIVNESFVKLDNSDLFLQIYGLYIVHKINWQMYTRLNSDYTKYMI